MISLAGYTLVVVGGAEGIGWATAELAAGLGAAVTIADVDVAGAARASALGGEAGFVECDATDPGAVERLIQGVVSRQGKIDGLVTTVGGAHLGPLESLELPAWEREISFNLTSVYAVCRGVLPVMAARGRGAIVTTSSGYAYLPAPDRIGYAAGKAGVVGFTRSLAAAAAEHGVRVNCVAPGPTDTPRFRAMNGGEAGVERVRQGMPLGEIPRPVDCARAIVFLVSDAARSITGQVLHVNGGVYMP